MTPPASLRTWAGSQRAGPPPPTLAEGQGGDDTNQKTFQFVLQSGNSKEKNRQALHKVRSHISRTRPKQKRRPPLPSWILQRDGHVVDVDAQYTSVPSRIGNDFSLANLPIELKPYICGDIAKGQHFLKCIANPRKKGQLTLTPPAYSTRANARRSLSARVVFASRPIAKLVDGKPNDRSSIYAFRHILGRVFPRWLLAPPPPPELHDATSLFNNHPDAAGSLK